MNQRNMSDNDNLNLLEDDLDDGEYDLGHEEEAALLADDFQQEESIGNEGFNHEETHFNYEEQEEEDVLVLNDVEDLEAEIQETVEEDTKLEVSQRNSSTIQQITGRSEDEEEKAHEERGRFKAERSSVGPRRGNVHIPDSLDTVPLAETGNQQRFGQNRGHWRGRGRGSRGFNNRGHQGRPFFQQAARNQGQLGRGFSAGGPNRGFMRGGPGRNQDRNPRSQQPNKIHINPHFRGNVQPQPDAARLVWDPNCVPPIVNQQQAGAVAIHQAEQHGFGGFQNQPPNMQQPLIHQQASLHQQQVLLQQQQHHLIQQQQQQQQQQQHQQHHPQHQQFNNQPQNFYQEPQQVPPQAQTPSPWMPQTQPPNIFPPQQPNLMTPQQEMFPPNQPQQGQQYMGQGYHGYQHQVPMQPPVQHHQRFPQHQSHQPPPHHPHQPPPHQPQSHQQQPFHQHKPPQQQQHYQANQRQMHGGFEGTGRPQFPSPPQHQAGPMRNRGGHFPMRGQRGHRGQSRGPLLQSGQGRTPPQKRLGPIDVPDTSLRSPPKRPKRKHDITNLHQVETVDTLPDTTVKEISQTLEADIEEDEELQEYRKKIEKQKELRETILQQKEERRKLAALEVQRKLQEKVLDTLAGGDASRSLNQQEGNAIATIVNLNTVEPPQTYVTNQFTRPMGRPMFKQHQPNLVNRGNITRIQLNSNLNPQIQARTVQVINQNQGPNFNRLPVQQRLGAQLPPQRTVSAIGQGVVRNVPNQVSTGVNQGVNSNVNLRVTRRVPIGQAGIIQQGRGGGMVGQRTVVAVRPQAGQPGGQQQQNNQMGKVSNVGQRMVTVSSTQTGATPKRVVLGPSASNTAARTVTLRTVANQTTQRIVVPPQKTGAARTVVATTAPQSTSKSVVIENLAASTTSLQMLKICQSVGPLEKFEMTPSLRKVEVTFKSAASALKFAKTHHRKMIDLSLINVTLVPAT